MLWLDYDGPSGWKQDEIPAVTGTRAGVFCPLCAAVMKWVMLDKFIKMYMIETDESNVLLEGEFTNFEAELSSDI